MNLYRDTLFQLQLLTLVHRTDRSVAIEQCHMLHTIDQLLLASTYYLLFPRDILISDSNDQIVHAKQHINTLVLL